MKYDLWKRAKPILNHALEQKPERWPMYLAESCGDDVDLFFEVTSLLAASKDLGDFIERPAIELLRVR